MGSIYRKFVSAMKEFWFILLNSKRETSDNFDEERSNSSRLSRKASHFKSHSSSSSETASFFENDINTEIATDKCKEPIEKYYFQPKRTHDASDTTVKPIPMANPTVSPSFPGSLSSISTAYVPQSVPSPPLDFCHPSIPSMSSSYDSQYVGSKITHHYGSSFSSTPCFVPSYRSSISPKSSMDGSGLREFDVKLKRKSNECNIPSKFFGSDNSQTPSYALAMAVARMQESQNTTDDNQEQTEIDVTLNYEDNSRPLQPKSSLIEKSREDLHMQKDAKKTKKVTIVNPIGSGKGGVQKLSRTHERKGHRRDTVVIVESSTAKRKKNRLHDEIRRISEDRRLSVDSLSTEIRRR